MKKTLVLILLFSLLILSPAQAGAARIPATPLMTLYKFNGSLDMPYYAVDAFLKRGPAVAAGSLAQGTSLIPCLVVRNGQPLTDSRGTPYVGFEIVIDSRNATRAATELFKKTLRQRQSMTVANHHCDNSVRYVIDVRNLYELEKAPFFTRPRATQAKNAARKPRSELDRVVRAFHNSRYCEQANSNLLRRRGSLEIAWQRFARDNRKHWPAATLERAKHLDYTMRTALFEGHLDRGCNAYGACERNIVALSIRNRARESCARHYGCSAYGDFQGVASAVSQYNIWDEFLTQISGLTSCFLRDDLADAEAAGTGYYAKLQAMHEQNLADFERILFGGDHELREIFPGGSLSDLKNMRHYYHAPAMGKCFPQYERIEYMSGAIARNGGDFALIANTRIQVRSAIEGDYFFRDFILEQKPDRDDVRMVDNYPGFVVDGRKVDLRSPSRCYPYGIPRGCGFNQIGRYRRTPTWLNAGKSLEIMCRVRDRGAGCQQAGTLTRVSVGGTCDTQMRPVSGVK